MNDIFEVKIYSVSISSPNNPKRYKLIINGEIWTYTTGAEYAELYRFINITDNYYRLPFNLNMDEDNPILTINKFITYLLLK